MEKLKIYSCNQERTLKMGIEKRALWTGQMAEEPTELNENFRIPGGHGHLRGSPFSRIDSGK